MPERYPRREDRWLATVVIEDAHDPRRALRSVLGTLSESLPRPGARVFLKPNLTYPRHRPGVTTSPAFMAIVLESFAEMGVGLTIGEGDGGYGSWSAETAFDGHGLRDLAARYGARLVNLSTMPTREITLIAAGGDVQMHLPRVLLDETDYFISLPVPKLHSNTVYSGAVKNQWGCIPDPMRLRYHPRFGHVIWGINAALRPQLVLADAQYMLDRSGPMEGDPVHMNRIIGGDDILAFDVAVVGSLMRIDPSTIPYLSEGASSHHSRPRRIVDRSTGPTHQFRLRRSLRARVVAFAFSREWAVRALWMSPLGTAAHAVFYSVRGNPVARERQLVERMARERDVLPGRPSHPER